MGVEFSKKSKGTGRICGKESVNLLCYTKDVKIQSGKNFFVLFGVVMFWRGGDIPRREAKNRCVSEVFWRSGADFSFVSKDWNGEFDHRRASLDCSRSR